MKNLIVERLPAPPPGKLKKFDIFSLGLGQVIGAGVFSIFGASMLFTGRSAWIALIAALLLGFLYVAPSIFVGATLRSDAGFYSYTSALVHPLAGSVYAFSILVDVSFSIMALSLASYVNSVFPAIPAKLVAIGFLTLIYVVNLFGVKSAARAQNIMVILLFAAILLFIGFGLPHMNGTIFSLSQPDFFSGGISGFISAVALLYYCCYGYVFMNTYGRDAQNARRDIPRMTIAVALCVVVLYLLCMFVALDVLPIEQVAGQPLTYVAQEIFPPVLFAFFIICGPVMALSTTLNGLFAIDANFLRSSANDGWLPKIFGKQNKHGAAWFSLSYGYFFGMIPILLNFSISTVTNLLNFMFSMVALLPLIGYYNLPRKYPDEWEHSTMRIPKWLFYVLTTLSILVQVFVFVTSIADLTPAIVTVSSIAMIIMVVFPIMRVKNSKEPLKTTIGVWGYKDEVTYAESVINGK